IMARAFHAQRMVGEERRPLGAPALRAIERSGHRIAPACVITIALALFAPANRAMDRWADGHDADLDGAGGDDDGGGNDNARDGFHRRGRATVPSIASI